MMARRHPFKKYAAILANVENYYRRKIEQFGPVPRGVDWKDTESQDLRFSQLLRLHDGHSPFSVNDLGCGYAGLFAYMSERFAHFTYHGCDVSRLMIATAKEAFSSSPNASFHVAAKPIRVADYTVASGIFNVKLDASKSVWLEYILYSLSQMDRNSRRGFAFNCLTKYSDRNRTRPDLYYADPCYLFDYCKKRFSRQVALLHDYGLYEFTILVRKQH
jgi:SAM-dependent methyltransferase